MQNCLRGNIEINSLLRFPLIVGVVFSHSLSLAHGNYKIYDFFYISLTEILCTTCVPLFFFFSGYMFFHNIESFDLGTYKNKLKRRVKSLFIPYVFWNLFVVAVIGIGQILAPSFFSGSFKNVMDFTVNDWLSIFYCAFGSNQPIAFQLWFIRNLMVMIVLTPLIYFLCRCFDYWWLLVLFLLPMIGINVLFPGFSFFSLSFFATGCWFGINKCSFIVKSINAKYLIIIAFIILYIIDFLFHKSNTVHVAFHYFCVVAGCISIIQAASLIVQHKDYTKFFFMEPAISNSTFFIYCYHGIFSAFITRFVIRFVSNDLMAVLGYFMVVFVLIAFGVLAFNFLSKLSPAIIGFITGGRN